GNLDGHSQRQGLGRDGERSRRGRRGETYGRAAVAPAGPLRVDREAGGLGRARPGDRDVPVWRERRSVGGGRQDRRLRDLAGRRDRLRSPGDLQGDLRARGEDGFELADIVSVLVL